MGLIKYNDLFFSLNLKKVYISSLINISQNFDELSKSLKYCNDVLNLIEIILINFDKLNTICKKDSKKIDISKICKPKKDDDLQQIIDLYLYLYTLQKENGNNIF